MMRSNPPDLSVPVTLPPEILDKILENIPTDDEGRQALIACASVATWWTAPSQRRLFSHIAIYPSNYRRWMDGVVLSGSKPHLLGHARSFSRIGITGNWYQTRNPPRDCGEYLSVLNNLHSLMLIDTRVETTSDEGFRTCFSAFRETLTSLCLSLFDTSFSALVTLVGFFPNLTTLRLRLRRLEPDEGPVPVLSRPLRGKVHVEYHGIDCLEFFNRFARLDLEYEELVICSACSSDQEQWLEIALRISASTVKFLTITDNYQCALTVSNFRQLRELGLKMDRSSCSQRGILSSVTSMELRKIIFSSDYIIFPERTETWGPIDEQLCELVDRLRATGYRHTLEVEVRVQAIGNDSGEDDFIEILPEFLPNFREKGIVTIIDASRGDRVLRHLFRS